MFWHEFKYDLKCCFREKSFLFWLILFPIILGLFFKVAFSNVYEKSEKFSLIPVAIVQNEENEVFEAVIDEISKGDDALFDPLFCEEAEALDKLENSKVSGVIYADDLSLTVHSDGIEPTIIKSFLEQYKIQEAVITETVMNNPQALESVVAAFDISEDFNENVPLTDGDMDSTNQFFHNLVAMVALFGSMTGLHISMSNQANLSQIGARKGISPTNKLVSTVAALCASSFAQIMCVVISVTYIAFVLRVDMGDNLPLVYLSGSVGGIMGVSFGFFIGSFGNMSEAAKGGISMSVTMMSCFLSGLMVGGMKALIAQKMPWFNKINPAAVISDTFYCLSVYNDYDMYISKIVTMLIMTAVFTLLGFLLTRRKKYASL